MLPVVRRILDGEHDFETLRVGLDRIDAYIVRTILARLSGEAPTPPAAQASPPPPAGEGALSLNDLLSAVALACTDQAPPGLGEQLYGLTQQLSQDPDAPAEFQALGRALNRILCGERDLDLSALPPELAQAIRRLLEELT